MEIVYATKKHFVTKDFDGTYVWYQIWETGADDWFDTAKTLQQAIDKVWEFEH